MQDDLIAVTQADREAANEWSFIECRHCSEYEGNFPADLAQAFARHRQQTEDAMRQLHGDMLRKTIEDGYPTPADKTAQCEHGQFGWEDCIACYDEQLLNTETAIRATPPKPDRLNGEGE